MGFGTAHLFALQPERGREKEVILPLGKELLFIKRGGPVIAGQGGQGGTGSHLHEKKGGGGN